MTDTTTNNIVAHSPGPWRVGRGADVNRNWKATDRYLVVSSGDGEWANTVAGRIPSEADARLIAAAPEMYALLRDLLAGFYTSPRGEFDGRIHAVLAKAEGRESLMDSMHVFDRGGPRDERGEAD